MIKRISLAAIVAASLTLAFSDTAQASPRSDCLDTCRGLDKGAWPACFLTCPAAGELPPVEMIDCGGGKMVPKGTSCPAIPPEMTDCGGGVKVPKGTKCPSDTPKLVRCDKEGKDIPANQWSKARCDKPSGGGPVEPPKCDAEKHETLVEGACACVDGFERFPTEGGACVEKCKDEERRNAEGTCQPVGACEDPCFLAAAEKAEAHSNMLIGAIGQSVFWLQMIFGSICAVFLLLLAWLFGAKDKLDAWKKNRAEKARRLAQMERQNAIQAQAVQQAAVQQAAVQQAAVVQPMATTIDPATTAAAPNVGPAPKSKSTEPPLFPAAGAPGPGSIDD